MHANCYHGNCGECRGQYVCNCLKVTEEALLEALATRPVQTVRELRELTGAGDGCTACHSRLVAYVERFSLALTVDAIS